MIPSNTRESFLRYLRRADSISGSTASATRARAIFRPDRARLAKRDAEADRRSAAVPSSVAIFATASTSRWATSATTSTISSALEGKLRYSVPKATSAVSATAFIWVSRNPTSLTNARAARRIEARLLSDGVRSRELRIGLLAGDICVLSESFQEQGNGW